MFPLTIIVSFDVTVPLFMSAQATLWVKVLLESELEPVWVERIVPFCVMIEV